MLAVGGKKRSTCLGIQKGTGAKPRRVADFFHTRGQVLIGSKCWEKKWAQTVSLLTPIRNSSLPPKSRSAQISAAANQEWQTDPQLNTKPSLSISIYFQDNSFLTSHWWFYSLLFLLCIEKVEMTLALSLRYCMGCWYTRQAVWKRQGTVPTKRSGHMSSHWLNYEPYTCVHRLLL